MVYFVSVKFYLFKNKNIIEACYLISSPKHPSTLSLFLLTSLPGHCYGGPTVSIRKRHPINSLEQQSDGCQGGRGRGLGERSEGVEQYRLVVTK